MAKVEIEMLDAQAVADLFGVSTRTLYRWIDQGLFPPAIKFNRRSHFWFRHQLIQTLEEMQTGGHAAKES
jgi:predicted DNA-binding transcriptional regulator AlpA